MNRRPLCVLLSVLLPACAAPEPVNEAASPIIGGTATTGDPAVVLLASYPADRSTILTCTAALIAPTVLLTAAHCVDPSTHAGHTFGVFTGPDASAYADAASLAPHLTSVKAMHMYPSYDPVAPYAGDIAVVVLDAPIAATPLLINRAALDPKTVGKAARIVGYGQVKYGDYNAVKHEATTTVVSIGPGDTMVVGDGMHRSCVGDSGGPALVTLDGVETIVGVDSYTELAGCLEPANYRRTDVYTAFLDDYAPPPLEDGGMGGGGGTGGNGGAAATSSSTTAGAGGATTTSSSGGSETSPGGCVFSSNARGSATSAPVLVALLAAMGLSRRRRRACR